MVTVTELLAGIGSIIPDTNLHFFFADFEEKNEKKIMGRVGKILFNKYKFGNCYLLKSGRGLHLVNFSDPLTFEKYVKILKEMEADKFYIKFVEKKKVGVLRLSRKSPHRKVPAISKVLISPHRKIEYAGFRNLYFLMLNLEHNIDKIIKVAIPNEI